MFRDDCFASPEGPITVADARERLAAAAWPERPVDSVPLAAAAGRVLAADIVAPADVPPRDNAAVDGFAVRHADLSPQAPTTLRLVGRAAAGRPFDGIVGAGEAVRVLTGAVLPAGPDTVVMQEDCLTVETADGPGVALPPGVRRGVNRRPAGEDVTKGAVVLRAGRILGPAALGLAASLGVTALPVRRPLRVTVFSTGDELREAGAPLSVGAVFDANRPILRALIAATGAEVTDGGILPDRAALVRDALADAAAASDVVVTSGGVSAGEEDHVKAAIVAAGGTVDLWRLALKPGRPIALGRIGERTAFAGLPGNPVAVVVTFLVLVRPLLMRLAGASSLPEAPRFPVRAGFAHHKKEGRRDYLRARLVRDDEGGWRAETYPRDGAGILSSIVESQGLVEIEEARTVVAPGDAVSYVSFAELLAPPL